MNMKIEDIEKAAIETAKKACDDFEEVFEFANGFMVGAEWRINSVWHDAKEQPKDWNADCLVEIESGGSSIFLLSHFYHSGGFSCMDGIHNERMRILRWAYIGDLLPNTEG